MYRKTVALLLIAISANAFADTGVLLPDSVVSNACVFSNIGVFDGEFEMIPVYEDAVYHCNPGQYLPVGAEECVKCQENFYCPGGDFLYNTTSAQGINQCPENTVAPAGMWEISQCGHVLHLGPDLLYLRSQQKTTPSLHFQIGDNIYYGNMTLLDTIMNANSDRKLKLYHDSKTYSVFDDTVSPAQ